MVSCFSKVFYLAGISLLAYSTCSYSHEYWLDPINATIDDGRKIIVDIRNGQNFSGISFPYDSAKYKSISIKNHSSTHSYKARLGDYPAIHHQADSDGLHSITLDTVESYIVYDTWQEFIDFLSYHGLEKIKEQHLEKNLPVTQIKEKYFRTAKTFLQINAQPDATENSEKTVLDSVGSLFELSLMENPYNQIETLNVQLEFAGAPLQGRQVEMFWKGSQLLRFTTITNEDGIASFTLLGDGDYMLNAVHIVEPEKQGVHWISYWASATFER